MNKSFSHFKTIETIYFSIVHCVFKIFNAFYLIICLSFYIFFSFFSHFPCSYMPIFGSSLSPITFFLMACSFITCLCVHLLAHYLHSHYLHVRHSSFVVCMCHLHCMFITCLCHMFITYLNHLLTYMSHVKVPTKLVVLCLSPFFCSLPPFV